MNLKKIALIALIVVMMVSSIIAFGCKPKQEEVVPADTIVTDTTVVVDTAVVQ